MTLQEVNKGNKIIHPSSFYVVFVPLVKTPLEALLFYRMDAKRERQSRSICEMTSSMTIKS